MKKNWIYPLIICCILVATNSNFNQATLNSISPQSESTIPIKVAEFNRTSSQSGSGEMEYVYFPLTYDPRGDRISIGEEFIFKHGQTGVYTLNEDNAQDFNNVTTRMTDGVDDSIDIFTNVIDGGGSGTAPTESYLFGTETDLVGYEISHITFNVTMLSIVFDGESTSVNTFVIFSIWTQQIVPTETVTTTDYQTETINHTETVSETVTSIEITTEVSISTLIIDSNLSEIATESETPISTVIIYMSIVAIVGLRVRRRSENQ